MDIARLGANLQYGRVPASLVVPAVSSLLGLLSIRCEGGCGRATPRGSSHRRKSRRGLPEVSSWACRCCYVRMLPFQNPKVLSECGLRLHLWLRIDGSRGLWLQIDAHLDYGRFSVLWKPASEALTKALEHRTAEAWPPVLAALVATQTEFLHGRWQRRT